MEVGVQRTALHNGEIAQRSLIKMAISNLDHHPFYLNLDFIPICIVVLSLLREYDPTSIQPEQLLTVKV